jgi:DNA-3-methyladenine glycosylase II
MPKAELTVSRQLTHQTLGHAVVDLSKRDADLGAVVERFGPPPMWARRPEFATLVRIIIEQQVSLAAARTMYERLRAATGSVTPSSVHQLGERGMRALGFTGQKSSYCVGLAEMILHGRLDLGAVARAETPKGRAMLLGVRGLGAWSVDIYFLMALRRPDIWPHGDLALADATHKVKRLTARPDYRSLTAMAEQWAPFRSVAARILWHHYLSTRVVPAK